MLHLLVALLVGAPSDSLLPAGSEVRIPAAVALESNEALDEASVSSPWAGADRQFLAGFAGGAMGSAGGAIAGGFAGLILGHAIYGSDNGDGWLPDWFGVAILGGMIGSATGGIYTTSAFVEWASSPDYPTRGKGPALLGSFLGCIGGGVLLGVFPGITSNEAGFWTGYATLLATSSLGAVLLDRASAAPAQVSVVPWLPRPGFTGARVGLAF